MPHVEVFCCASPHSAPPCQRRSLGFLRQGISFSMRSFHMPSSPNVPVHFGCCCEGGMVAIDLSEDARTRGKG